MWYRTLFACLWDVDVGGVDAADATLDATAWDWTLWVTFVEAGVKLQAVPGPPAKPHLSSVVTADGRRAEEPDQRTHGQRMHDAVERCVIGCCDRMRSWNAATCLTTTALPV